MTFYLPHTDRAPTRFGTQLKVRPDRQSEKPTAGAGRFARCGAYTLEDGLEDSADDEVDRESGDQVNRPHELGEDVNIDGVKRIENLERHINLSAARATPSRRTPTTKAEWPNPSH